MSKTKRLKNKRIKFPDTENNQTQDRSPIVPQRHKIDHFLRITKRELTEKQQKFVDLAMDKSVKMLLVSGPAGTTKTYLSVLVSLLLMNEKKISDILYVRSVVESADVKMGTLPGEADDKLSPFKRPLIDKLEEFLPREDIQFLIKDNRVEGLPIGYLRGLNWNAKAIIGDEMQNCTKREIVTMMTRTGEFSKVFICGDPQQADIGPRSGFKDIYNMFNDEESKQHGIYTFEFTADDILRSELVKYIAKKINGFN
jgi:phosphate starvation-inducible protein PhoH and related proteins